MLILVGSSGSAQQEPSIQELLTIEKLIDDGDLRALYVYLEGNPSLTAGNGPLAIELRSFVDDAKRGRLTGFNARSGTPRGGVSTSENTRIY
jgi:hypothetical protein